MPAGPTSTDDEGAFVKYLYVVESIGQLQPVDLELRVLA